MTFTEPKKDIAPDYYVVTTRNAEGKETRKKVPFSARGTALNDESHKPQRETGKTVKAEINPSSEKLLDAVNRARFRKGKIITEVGCGNKISISLGRKDLWVGVDPSVNPDTTTLERGFNQIYSDSERILIKDYVSAIPDIDPNLVLMVAPNPADITDNDLLSSVLDKTMSGNASLLMVLDTQSYESVLNPRSLELDGSGLVEITKNVGKHFKLRDYDIEVVPWYEDDIDSDEMRDFFGISNPVNFNSNFLPQKKLLIIVRKK